MLHGNPLVDMLAEKGIKMAGGRQGKEVGKQEREFMEGWVKKEKPRGVVDMVVSRFGEEEAGGAPSGDVPGSKTPTPKTGWFWPSPHLGGSKETKKPVEDLPPVLMPTDGCVFRGIGVLETKDVANYLTELYEKGDDSYTVTSSGVRRKKKKKRPTEFNTGTGLSSGESSPRRSTSTIRHARAGPDLRPGSTLAIRGSESQPLERLESPLEEPLANSDAPVEEPSANSDTSVAGSASGETSSHKPRSLSIANGKFLNMLTFGWGDRIQQQLSHRGSAVPSDAEDSSAIDDTPEAPPEPAAAVPPIESLPEPEETGKKRGVFLVGYQGDLDIEDIDDDFENSDGRITSRTVWLSRTLKIEDEGQSSTAEPDIPDPERTAKPPALEEFKLVVYTVSPPEWGGCSTLTLTE